jgi:hypothetical protein
MRMERSEDFQQAVSALVHPTIPEHPNLKSPTLFPYSLAAVCSFWRDILCCNPEFWALVVLFIDFKPKPLVETSLCLKWSRRHHIDASIRTSRKILSGSTRKMSDRRLSPYPQILPMSPFPRSSTANVFSAPNTIHTYSSSTPPVYSSNLRPLSGFASLHPSPPHAQRMRKKAVKEEEPSPLRGENRVDRYGRAVFVLGPTRNRR